VLVCFGGERCDVLLQCTWEGPVGDRGSPPTEFPLWAKRDVVHDDALYSL